MKISGQTGHMVNFASIISNFLGGLSQVPWTQLSVSIISGITVAVFSSMISRKLEREKWLNYELYQPLLDELGELNSGNIPEEPVWSEFGQYKKYRVGTELKEKLDEYSEKISELNTQLRLEDKDSFLKRIPNEIHNDNNVNQINDGWCPPDLFISNHTYAILEADDREEFDHIFREYYFPEYIEDEVYQKLEEENPVWTKELYDVLEEDSVINNLNQKKQLWKEIKQLSDEIESILRLRIDRTILKI